MSVAPREPATGRPTVLVLTFARRGEEGAIGRALDWLSRELPGARFAAVGTPVSAPVLRAVGIEEIATLGGGRSAVQVIADSRAQRPASAAIIYSGPGTRGHLKLEALALAAGAPRAYRFTPDRPPQLVGRWRLLASVKAKLLQAGICLLSGAATCAAACCYLRLRQLVAGGGRARRP